MRWQAFRELRGNDVRADAVLIKICGLTQQADAELAEKRGADFLGAILAGGPRNLTPHAARHVLGPRRHSVRRVAVFAAQTLTEIAASAELIDVDVVQLHGESTASDVQWLRDRLACAVWPVVRVEGTVIPAASIELAHAAGALLLDAKVVGQLGGTGTKLDWGGLRDEVRTLRRRVPSLQLVLAGGLTARNVTNAQQLLDPDVADVSSGVESAPGIKSAAEITAFINAIRSTTTHATGHLE